MATIYQVSELAGVSLATLMTIYVVPVMYIALARNTGSPKRLEHKLQQLEKEAPDEHAADEVHPS